MVSLAPDLLAAALAHRGHAVRYAASMAAAMQWLDEDDPDLLIVDATLPDEQALALCRTLRATAVDDRPIIVTDPVELPAIELIAFLRAGAWDVLAPAPDTEFDVPMLRLETWMRAYRKGARERRESLTDAGTGLYSRAGLARRAQELGAQVRRNRDPLACVVFRLDFASEADATMTSCGRIFQQQARGGDAVARFGAFHIAVLAPRTDSVGAIRLARRLAEAVRSGHPHAWTTHGLSMTAAYNSADVSDEIALEPIDLVTHAATTLRSTPLPPAGPWLFTADFPVTTRS